MAPPLLQLKDIALTFGGTPLLTGAELSVSPAERVSLVGRNGSGKSTLLRIAAGLVEPDRGTVFAQPGALIRYLPQEPDFSGCTTTRAYVEDGLTPTDDPHVAQFMLEQLGLSGDDAFHVKVSELRFSPVKNPTVRGGAPALPHGSRRSSHYSFCARPAPTILIRSFKKRLLASNRLCVGTARPVTGTYVE